MKGGIKITTIDIRFSGNEMQMLSNMIGKEMISYECDPLLSSTNVYGIVGFRIRNDSYAITNQIRTMDYFGVTEDVALMSLIEKPYDEINSMIQGSKMFLISVNRLIAAIDIVNETQKLFEDRKQTYEVRLTRSLIFHFHDGSELSFEKNVWFSECISIEKGHDLINRFSPVTEFSENWKDEFIGECAREIITIGRPN